MIVDDFRVNTERQDEIDHVVGLIDGGFKSYLVLQTATAATIVVLSAVCVAEESERNAVTDITTLIGSALKWASMMTATAWSCFYGQRSDCKQAAVEIVRRDPALFWASIEAYRKKASPEHVAAMEAWLQAEGLSNGR